MVGWRPGLGAGDMPKAWPVATSGLKAVARIRLDLLWLGPLLWLGWQADVG